MNINKMTHNHRILLAVFLIFVSSFACVKDGTPVINGNSDDIRELVILYTNDEHGWIKKSDDYGGAAGMMGLWRQNEQFTENSKFLVLSGGDVWTGPAISTWFKGESMIDVMNAMHYSAAAIGNHEFDFQVSTLKARISQANFPFVSANIRLKSNGQTPDFVQPYTIVEKNGVKIGIIGLTAMNTIYSAFPDYVKDYNFIDYATAIRETVPAAKGAGAQLLIIVGHICKSEMAELSSVASELGISLIGGAHCHEVVNEKVNGVQLIEAGSYLRNYVRVNIKFNMDKGNVESVTASVLPNQGSTPDPTVAATVATWEEKETEQLSEVIGYVQNRIANGSTPMYNMIADSWLHAFPNADVSISNTGGVRQSIEAGEITLGDIVGVLPFENSIVQLKLTGKQLKDSLNSSLFVGGMTTLNGYFLSDGSPLNDSQSYTVLITDFIYSAYDQFARFDPAPYTSGVNWRQPLIDWIRSKNSSESNPLDQYLDNMDRQTARSYRHIDIRQHEH